jgi:hypothetical protein
VKEEVAIQTSKLTEAYKTIKSREDSLSQVETNVALLTEQNNGLQVGRTNLENELKKLREEAGSQADKLVDAYATIKSLEDTLLRAENDISVLEGAKKNAEEEVLSLNSKLSAALEELAGTSGSLESRSVELAGHYNDLQVIMKDDTLLSKAKECFEKKFESLKNMDLILKNIRDRFVDMDLEELQSQHVMEVKYSVYMVFNLVKCTLLFLLVSYICTGGFEFTILPSIPFLWGMLFCWISMCMDLAFAFLYLDSGLVIVFTCNHSECIIFYTPISLVFLELLSLTNHLHL